MNTTELDGEKRIQNYKDELNIVFQKSQEAFEKQLSFISAGALALSVGFIDKIVKNFDQSSCKVILAIGWVLLIKTLLLNLISHLISSRNTNLSIKEINEDKYDPINIEKRNKTIVRFNWMSVLLMIIGLMLIILFIIINIIL